MFVWDGQGHKSESYIRKWRILNALTYMILRAISNRKEYSRVTHQRLCMRTYNLQLLPTAYRKPIE